MYTMLLRFSTVRMGAALLAAAYHRIETVPVMTESRPPTASWFL